MKKLQHFAEVALLKWLFAAMRLMPLDLASFTGGFIARGIGPFFSAQKTAKKNLAMIFPEKSDRERDKIISGMWDNLGRVAAELSHLPGHSLINRYTLHGEEHMPKQGETVLFFSGHIGNWELLPSVPYRRGTGITIVYRHANNPHVDDMIAKLRASQSDDMIAKGPRGAFKLAKTLKKKKSICMLVDQKMNDGISVPFFGRPAMTAPAIAQLALHYNLPIIPARVVRTKGAHFDIMVYPPVAYEKTGDDAKDTLAIMTQINIMLEGWIREHPEQWFWVHQRWPKA